jgi:hypothetical protein
LTPDDPHPLPHILEYLDDACGAVVFTSLDLKGSFHQSIPNGWTKSGLDKTRPR